jgi:phage terminase small subunit|tara:strand:+ start:261 stop:815 length:555 start_codon:yes stop_codon:yes gene_type:complete
MAKLSKSKINKIEKHHNRKLTDRQKTFAKYIVEGIYSNSECARKSGYSPEVSNKQASVFLNGRDFPHVVEYIAELREEKERRYGVTLMGQLERLHELSRDAQENKQFSASINAEKIRSALGGLSTDRRSSEVTHVIDQMSKDEIVARLYALQKNYPQAFVINEDVEDAESRDESLEYLPTKTEG